MTGHKKAEDSDNKPWWVFDSKDPFNSASSYNPTEWHDASKRYRNNQD